MDRSSSYLTQIQLFSPLLSPSKASHRAPDAVDNLIQTQSLIQKHINTWAQLNKTFHKKQQQSFLMTFNEIMEKMAAELAVAQEKYENVDLEIKKDERCQRLEQEVHFFREECLVMKEKVEGLRKEVVGLRLENQSLKEEAFVLKKKLNKRAEQFAMDRTVCGGFTGVNSSTTKSFYLTEKPRVDHDNDDSGLEGLIHNLRSHNPKQGISLIKRFINDQVKSGQNANMKKLIKSPSLAAKQTPLYPTIIDNDFPHSSRNEFMEIWSDCVKEFKINRKLIKQMSKQSKYKLLESFLSSEKFIELLRRKIFGEKCCSNWNCLGNLEQQQGEEGEMGNSPPPRRTIQTADRPFRNSRYSRKLMGSNKNRIIHLENSQWN